MSVLRRTPEGRPRPQLSQYPPRTGNRSGWFLSSAESYTAPCARTRTYILSVCIYIYVYTDTYTYVPTLHTVNQEGASRTCLSRVRRRAHRQAFRHLGSGHLIMGLLSNILRLHACRPTGSGCARRSAFNGLGTLGTPWPQGCHPNNPQKV